MDKIGMSFTQEELSVVVEMMNNATPPAGRRRAAVFYRLREGMQLALATTLEDEEDGE